LIKYIAARHSQVKVLVWTMHEASMYAERALRAGARAYITKEHATEQIVDAIRRVRDGETFQADRPDEAPMYVDETGGPYADKDSSPEALSNRELEVFRQLGEGFDMHAISERMGLSVKTIETYRARIKRKLNVKGRTQLIQVAVEWALSRR
jgi:DNA-binding NarL/FixJ family response regulator